MTTELEYAEWLLTLGSDPDIMAGEATYPGTRLTVRHIGMRLRGANVFAEILDDYPYLTVKDLELTLRYMRGKA